jgi:hypothetical protein
MNFGDRYGLFDRLLYRIAFRADTAQHALADVEEMLYRDRLDSIEADDPVFITALPRAGTTILLKLFWSTGHFATHTYQDMPFVLAPLLWSQYAESFARDIEPTERAHGDGLEVSGKSPEAFEEMVWKQFWPEHYRRDRIRPWTSGDQNSEFEAFFERHMRKVLAVREEEAPGAERYLSKNNLNIARLAAPPPPLQRGTFIVPFRHPLQQAASMKRQHERFLKLHEEDDFVREYMEAIGHHEFGKGLKPVDFDGWLEDAAPPSELTFWVQYWMAAYRFVLRHAEDNVVLLSYARLTEDSEGTLSHLADQLGIPQTDLMEQTDRLRSPRKHSVDESRLPDRVSREASEIYDQMSRRAIA